MKWDSGDAKTMGTASNSAIVAIGAVKFSSKGVSDDDFYCIIDLNTSMKAGGVLNPSTIIWWMQQSEEARKQLYRKDTESLFNGLKRFSQWVGDKTTAKMWGNGAAFDNIILANAYDSVNLERPWNFYNDRCYRTVKNLLGGNIKYVPPVVAHNAVEDAKAQAVHLVKILQAIGGGG